MTVFTKQDAINIGKKLNIDFNKYSLDDFTYGLNVELEHGKVTPFTNVTNDDLEITAKIAFAHMLETPDYYVRLKQMEEDIPSSSISNPRAILTVIGLYLAYLLV